MADKPPPVMGVPLVPGVVGAEIIGGEGGGVVGDAGVLGMGGGGGGGVGKEPSEGKQQATVERQLEKKMLRVKKLLGEIGELAGNTHRYLCVVEKTNGDILATSCQEWAPWLEGKNLPHRTSLNHLLSVESMPYDHMSEIDMPAEEPEASVSKAMGSLSRRQRRSLLVALGWSKLKKVAESTGVPPTLHRFQGMVVDLGAKSEDDGGAATKFKKRAFDPVDLVMSKTWKKKEECHEYTDDNKRFLGIESLLQIPDSMMPAGVMEAALGILLEYHDPDHWKSKAPSAALEQAYKHLLGTSWWLKHQSGEAGEASGVTSLQPLTPLQRTNIVNFLIFPVWNMADCRYSAGAARAQGGARSRVKKSGPGKIINLGCGVKDGEVGGVEGDSDDSDEDKGGARQAQQVDLGGGDGGGVLEDGKGKKRKGDGDEDDEDDDGDKDGTKKAKLTYYSVICARS